MEGQYHPNRAFPPLSDRTSTTDDDGGFFGFTTSSSFEFGDSNTQTTLDTLTLTDEVTTTSDSFGGFGDGGTTASGSSSSTALNFFGGPGPVSIQTSALQTQTSAIESSSTYSKASEGQATQSTAITQHQHDHDSNSLSTGQLAAAIVVPILTVLLLALGACFFLHRRKQQNARNRGDSGASFLPLGLKEKWGSLRSSSSHSDHRPEVMNVENNAYYTGLDTSSRGTRSDENARDVPPPPYPAAAVTRNSTLPEVPQFQQMEFGNFATPPATSHADQNPPYLAAMSDPPRPSSRSARSFTSTLYSDTASVHSARAARRSFGPNVIQPVVSGGNLDGGSRGGSGEVSPASPLDERDGSRHA